MSGPDPWDALDDEVDSDWEARSRNLHPEPFPSMQHRSMVVT